MNLKDVLVMEVPYEVLKKVVKNKNLKAKLSSSEEMASAIVEQDIQTGIELANEFKFAGSTAVNLNIVMKGISPEWHDKEYFKTKLSEKFSPAIFNGGIRPKLDKKPKLISAHDLNDKLVLAFSCLGATKRFLEDFVIVSRSPQIVEYVIIHFSPFSVEVRASSDHNELYRDSVIEIMGIDPKDVVWDKATKLNEQQANKLAVRLGARLRAAKHKMTEGPYATKEVTAHTKIEDLERNVQYQKEFNNQPMKKKTLIFDYTYSFGYEDTISYVITEEGLWIRTKVGEEVISYILDQIIKIKYTIEEDTEGEFQEIDYMQTDIEDQIELENHVN